MTTWASDGSSTDVQTQINSAADGDTVTIPDGSFIWETSVTISGKGIKLQGAGSGRVVARSGSSVTIGTGEKTFTLYTEAVASIEALKSALVAGTTIHIQRTGSKIVGGFPSSDIPWMEGTVTSFTGTTLVMNITSTNGSGTLQPWILETMPTTTVKGAITTSQNKMLEITEDVSNNTEVSGIRFEQTASQASESWLVGILYTASGKPVLIHDCYFYRTQNGSMIYSSSIQKGVVWNCTFNAGVFTGSASTAFHIFDLSGSGGPGFTSWQSASTFGSADTDGLGNFTVEDSDFHCWTTASDIDDGGRFVINHCLVNNAGFGSHGTDSSPVGCRHIQILNSEVYFNRYSDGQTQNALWVLLLRGGTAVITGNTMTTNSGSDYGTGGGITLAAWKLQVGRDASPAELSWGENVVGAQYPYPRQVGLGYVTGSGVDGLGNSTYNGGNGALYVGDSEPVYIWGNTVSGGTMDTPSASNYYTPTGGEDSAADYIVSGRDYFFNAGAKAGFSMPTYPHPLRTDLTQVSAPTFLPVAGTYETTQSVVISIVTAGATIRYTTNGSTPTNLLGTIYTSAVSVTETTTIKAIAYDGVLTDSEVSSGTFTISAAQSTVATPTFSTQELYDEQGLFVSVTISCATSGASIYYTIDGSTPTTASTLYSSAFATLVDIVVKAIAVKTNYTNSVVGQANIDYPDVVTPFVITRLTVRTLRVG